MNTSSVFARAAFGMLVLATAGAFLITQRLKRSPPPIVRVSHGKYLSPNGDGRRDSIAMGFYLRRAQRTTVSLIDARGDRVRTLADAASLRVGPHRFRWNGRTDAGRVAPDGAYRLRVAVHAEGRSLIVPRPLFVDTTPPHPRILGVTPSTFVPGAPGPRGRAIVRYAARSRSVPTVTVYRTDAGPPAPIARFAGARGRGAISWDGRVGGRVAPDGVYAFSLAVRDRAENLGTDPASLPPTPVGTRPGTGVTARRLALAGPLTPVTAGSVARFRLAPVPLRFRWRLGRLGARRAGRRGRGRGTAFAVRIPRRSRTGLAILRVRTPAGRAVWPLAVRSRRAGRGRPVLAVLPAITWAGRNPVDVDRDGFADTLDGAHAIPLGAPFAGGRLPEGFRRGVGPLLRLLDGERRRYDVTTDLALARGHGPDLGGRPGVAFVGDERWVPRDLAERVRRYVERGGRVASFGTDAFRRGVTVAPGRLVDPTPPAPVNALGERTAPFPAPGVEAPPPAPLVALSDRLGLFTGSGGTVGMFSRLELSMGLERGARELATAGRGEDPEHPAFIAYRLGRGIVVRPGAPDWGRAAVERADVARLTRRVWSLLSR